MWYDFSSVYAEMTVDDNYWCCEKYEYYARKEFHSSKYLEAIKVYDQGSDMHISPFQTEYYESKIKSS